VRNRWLWIRVEEGPFGLSGLAGGDPGVNLGRAFRGLASENSAALGAGFLQALPK
jgi:hypothetical protein